MGKSQKRDISQSIIYGIYSKFSHLHLEHKLCTKYQDPRTSLKKGMILQSNIHRIRKFNQVLCIMCPVCLISWSPDILLTRLLYYTKRQSQKRLFSEFCQILNLVIYTLGTICVPNIMIPAQVVLQIICIMYPKSGERGGSVVECRTPEREVRGSRPTAAVLCPWARHFTPRKYWLITQEAMAPSRHDWKIVDWDVKPQHNQPTNLKSMHDIMILAQAYLQIFCWQDCFTFASTTWYPATVLIFLLRMFWHKKYKCIYQIWSNPPITSQDIEHKHNSKINQGS